jgi:predicted permease
MAPLRLLDAIRQDTRYAMRIMRAAPGFAIATILTLALAIGGATAMFTVIRAVLLRPLVYRDPDRLMRIQGGATTSRFAEMRAAAHSFTALGAYAGYDDVTLSGGTEPVVLKAVHVSASFLPILGVHPLVGRGFRAEEDGPGGAPVAMISAELWRQHFGSDPSIAGKTALLEDAPYTIVGVLPAQFRFPFRGLDIWMTGPADLASLPARVRELSPYLTVFGRLKPGVTMAQANAELTVIRRRYAMAHPAMLDAKAKTPMEVEAMKESMVADVRSMLWMLFGAAAFVLLIACANIAGLLLARATTRAREFAVRAALGAERMHLIRQLLAESVLLSLAGGVLGVLLAAFSVRAIPHMTAFQLPRSSEVRLDGLVLAFAAAVSFATGVIFGLAPALGASRYDLMAVLRSSGAAAQAGIPRKFLGGLHLRDILIVGQVALSILLLIGAALLMESVAQLRHVDVGFNPSNLLTFAVSLPPVRYDTPQKKATFYDQLTHRLDALPGVRKASASMALPMLASPGTPVQDAAKPPLPLNQRPIATYFPVTPGYFQTLGIPLRRGRDFAAQDTADAQRVAIIDETLARRFWPAYPAGVDPVGQRIFVGGLVPKPALIVGVAANVHQFLEGNVWPETVYVAFSQTPWSSAMVAVRTAGDPLSLARVVRDQVQAIDPDQGIADVHTMDYLLEQQVGQRRLLTILLGSFAGVALLLALIGIYAAMAYAVAQRTQEVGIRRALGAQEADILRLVMRRGFVLTAAGIAIGLAGASELTGVLNTLLFHVSATDRMTFAAIAALFLGVALAASYIPARRAARIDPMAALRL